MWLSDVHVGKTAARKLADIKLGLPACFADSTQASLVLVVRQEIYPNSDLHQLSCPTPLKHGSYLHKRYTQKKLPENVLGHCKASERPILHLVHGWDSVEN